MRTPVASFLRWRRRRPGRRRASQAAGAQGTRCCCSCGTARPPPPGACCRAGRKGLHLSDAGRRRGRGRRRAHRAVRRPRRRRLRVAAGADPRDGRADRRPRSASRSWSTRGLLEADFGEWTGAELKALFKRPEWRTVQHRPSGFRFPGGESFAEMQLRICSARRPPGRRPSWPGRRRRQPRRPDQGDVAQTMGCHLDLFQRIVVSPCSVTAVAHGAGTGRSCCA